METIRELKPICDSAKSFYKKAYEIIDENNKISLKSYNTIVAYIEANDAYIIGLYSKTTTRHIKEFLRQHSFRVVSTKQIIQDYMNDCRIKIEEINNQYCLTI